VPEKTLATVNLDGGDCEPPRLALRPRDAARSLGIGERLLWSLTNQGIIPHVKLGRATLYPVRELRRWLTEEAGKGVGR
jgi:hypothetical protein